MSTSPGVQYAARLRWHQRLWVRIYVVLVLQTLLLAAIGLAAWEVLNDFPSPHFHGNQLWATPGAAPSMERGPPPLPSDGPPRGPPDFKAPGDQPPGNPPPDLPRRARGGGPGKAPPLPIPLVMFLITSVAMLVVAYPLARRLARSVERIASPVHAFGQGDLAARAPTDGPGEVGGLAREFNDAADRVQALIRSQQSLLANASHELRSPLARIQMQLEKIGERSSVEIRADIRREIAELDALVEEILLSSRLQSEHRPKLGDDVELLGLVAEEAARVGATVDGALVTVRGDSRLLRRVIRNMLENAVRYSGSAASVEACVSATGGNAVIDILDRGPGVSDSERERIFEPFYRARGARETAGGVGLGLSLARQIAHEHAGTLECFARSGGGGHFRLTLPAPGPCRAAG